MCEAPRLAHPGVTGERSELPPEDRPVHLRRLAPERAREVRPRLIDVTPGGVQLGGRCARGRVRADEPPLGDGVGLVAAVEWTGDHRDRDRAVDLDDRGQYRRARPH